MDIKALIRQKNIKAVIFDCDGTLVDSELSHHQGWQYSLHDYHHPFSLEEYSVWVGKSVEAIAQYLASRLQKDNAKELIHKKREHRHLAQSSGATPIADTVMFLTLLAKEKEHLGIKLGLASASAKGEILNNLRSLHIEHLFDVIISGQNDLQDYHDPEGTNKPKPYIYLHTAKLLGISPSKCIVVEDSQPGVSAGVDAGCFTIAVPNAYTAGHDFSRAHLTLESFKGMDIGNFLEKIPAL